MNHSSEILPEVARIACVSEARHASFVRLLGHSIEQAKKDSLRPAGKNVSAGLLQREFLNPIARSASDLRIGLQRLGGDHLAVGEAGASMAAAHFFGEMLPTRSRTDEAHNGIADLIPSIDLIIETAERADKSAKRFLSKAGRKRGTANPAFDMFVRWLLEICEQGGGKLTIYRTSHGDERWDGSLLRAIEQLRPILPQTNFFPKGTLGHSLNTVYQRRQAESGTRAAKSREIVSKNK